MPIRRFDLTDQVIPTKVLAHAPARCLSDAAPQRLVVE
jgi:hypothetical protein